MNRPDRFRRSTVEYFHSSNGAFSFSSQLSWWLGRSSSGCLCCSRCEDEMRPGTLAVRSRHTISAIGYSPSSRSEIAIPNICILLATSIAVAPHVVSRTWGDGSGASAGTRAPSGRGTPTRRNSKTFSQRACDAVASSFQSAARMGRAFRPAHAAAPAFSVAAVRVGADRLPGRDRLRGSLSRVAAPRGCRSMLQSGWLAPIPAR